MMPKTIQRDDLKVALCISGQMRTHLSCLGSWHRAFLARYNPEVFIHTWTDAGPGARYEKVSEDQLVGQYLVRGVEIEEKTEGYNYKIGNISVPEALIRAEPRHSRNTLPMLYSMHRADALRRRYEKTYGFEYDLVIKCRPDVQFFGPPLRLKKMPPGQIYLEACYLDIRYLASDKFAYGSSSAMNKYSRTFELLEVYWQDPIGDGAWGNILSDERLMKHHLKTTGLKQRIAPILFFIRRTREMRWSQEKFEEMKSVQRLAKNALFTLTTHTEIKL